MIERRMEMTDRKYKDLHEHLELLEKKGLLIRVNREINKDTELHPLVRWQFRGGIAEEDRKAFLFQNVTDTKGRNYDIPVVVGALAANPQIYCLGVGCERDEVGEVWRKALSAAIAPLIVDKGPAQK
jgi:4-hydroxy-3-polyprenylbenzoate decarboxylase